jgi:hypothetical protein
MEGEGNTRTRWKYHTTLVGTVSSSPHHPSDYVCGTATPTGSDRSGIEQQQQQQQQQSSLSLPGRFQGQGDGEI